MKLDSFVLRSLLLLALVSNEQLRGDDSPSAEWYALGYEIGAQARPIQKAFPEKRWDAIAQIPVILDLLGAPGTTVGALETSALHAGWTDALAGTPPAKTPPENLLASSLPPSLQRASLRSTTATAKTFQPNSLETWAKAVVRIKTKSGHGSGFFITKDLILTNRHVVDDVGVGEEILVRIEDSREVLATVFARAEKKDLALVRATTIVPHETLRIGNSDKARLGSPLALFGYPIEDHLPISINQGSIASLGVIYESEQFGLMNMIKLDVTTNPGNSGGPLVGLDGKVLAVHCIGYKKSEGADRMNFAIAINDAAQLLQDHAPEVYRDSE